MKLDLTRDGALLPEHARRLDAIADEIRRPFHALIAQLSAAHTSSIDWWVTPVASRNTFSSDLYLRCCQALLAVRVAESETALEETLVDSPALAAAISGALADRAVRVRCTRRAWRVLAGQIALRCRRLAAALYSYTSRYLAARLLPVRTTVPARPITLVDTLVYANSFDESGRFRDHHYPGLIDHLGPEERVALYFVPTFYRIRRYGALFRRLRAARENFLLEEDYLHFFDYVHALAHPLRVPRLPGGPIKLLSVDIGPLVREAMARGFAESGSLEAILRQRFARRLKERGVRLRLVLEWFENQELDRGAVAGLRAHYPEVPIVGYQGYVVSRHYLCMFPTEQERASGVIPDRVAVIGPELVVPAREFSPALEVEVSPAFRFRNLWQERERSRDSGALTVLAALPIMLEEARDILSRLVPACDGPARARPWRIRLKPHPVMPPANLAAALGRPLPQGWELVSGELDDLIAQADVLVSSASSACVQALASGVPVVVMGSLRGLTQNPIPAATDQRLWTLCYTAAEVRAALERFGARTQDEIRRERELGFALRERFFTPVTRESVARLLRLG